jgi:hypothetical protein
MTRATDATVTAASTLAALSDRMSQAAQSLARMVARLATEGDPTKVVTSIAKYVNAGLPEAEAVADVAAVIEGGQSAEWRERRAKMRKRSQQQKLAWQLSCGRFHDADLPDWSRSIILDAARERRDVMAAAIAACEQREDSEKILAALSRHLVGRDSSSELQSALRREGLSVQGSNVVPLIPSRGRA